MSDFVQMYNPGLPGTPHVRAATQAEAAYAARGWLVVDGSTPPPTDIYLTPGVGDLRYAKTADVGNPATRTGAALRSALVPRGSMQAGAGPPEGIPALVGNGTTNDQPALQAMLTYIKTTYGGGVLTLPPNTTMVLASGLIVPAGVRIHGDSTSVLKYTATSGAAIVINDGQCTPLVGFKLTGPGQTGNTAVGVSITGTRMVYRDLEVRLFYRCVDLVHSNTYIHDFDGCRFGNATTIIWADWSAKAGGTSVSNSGERIVFRGCLLDNSTEAAYASSNGGTMFFIGTSIDYVGSFGSFWDLDVHFNGCHLEANTSTVTTAYMMSGLGNPHISFSETTIIMGGSAGLINVVGQHPFNYDGGYMRTSNSAVYFTPQSGGAKRSQSKEIVLLSAAATSVTVYSAWVTKWNTISVRFVAQDATLPPSGITAAITAINTTNGSITVTFSGALPAPAFLEVSY